MNRPREAPAGGPAAALADRIAGHVPAIATDRFRVRAPRIGARRDLQSEAGLGHDRPVFRHQPETV